MRPPRPLFPLARALVTVSVCTLAFGSCIDAPTAPSGARWAHGVAFDATFPPVFQTLPAAASTLVPFERVRVLIRRANGSIALDTTIAFPSGSAEVSLGLNVPLAADSPPAGEEVTVSLAYVNAAQDTVFRGGPRSTTLVGNTGGRPQPSPITVPLVYTGPGWNAARVRVLPPTLSVMGGDPFAVGAEAVDGNGAPVPAPVMFTSLDPSIATISSFASGTGSAVATRGTARVVAQLLTGQADTAVVTVNPRPISLQPLGGNGQTGLVGAPLPQPVRVIVLAADGLGVSGVSVNFAANSGGSVGSATVITDASGMAETTWRLGNIAGPQTLIASVSGLAGSPLIFNSTASSMPATHLLIPSAPSNVIAGAPFALSVLALDANGAVVGGFTGTVSLTIGDGPPGATLGGSTAISAVTGVATFPALTLDHAGTEYTIVASATGLGGATTPSFAVYAAEPASCDVVSGNGQSAIVGEQLGAPIIVRVSDVYGNRVSGATVSAAAGSGGVVSPTSGQTDASGNVTFTWRLGSAAGTQTLRVTCSGIATPLDVTAMATTDGVTQEAATHLVFAPGPSTQTAGVPFAPGVRVEARNGNGGVVTGFSGTVTLALGVNPTGDVLLGTTAVTASNGVAQFPGDLRLLRAGTGYTMIAATPAPGVQAAASNPFDIAPAAASTIVAESGDAQVSAVGSSLDQQIVVLVRDSYGNPVPDAPLSWAVTSGGGQLSNSSAQTDASGRGHAVWTLGSTPGEQTATVSSTALPGQTVTFTATALESIGNATWTGAVSDDWFVGANWVSGVVPDANTDAIISAGSLNQPRLTASTANVRTLTVTTGARVRLDGNTLRVFGNLVADTIGGVICGSGPGVVEMAAPRSQTIRGRACSVLVPSNGNVSLGGVTVVEQTVSIRGIFDVNGRWLFTGALATEGAGLLRMRGAADSVVARTVTFAGGNTSGDITHGMLRVLESFSVPVARAFVSSQPHAVVLSPGMPGGTVQVGPIDSTMNRFGDLVIDGSVNWTTFARVQGFAGLTANARLSGPGKLQVNGDIRGSRFSELTLRSVALTGVLADSGLFAPDTVTFYGASQRIPVSVGGRKPEYQRVIVASAAARAWSDTAMTFGSLLITNGAQLRVGQAGTVTSLTVTGSLVTEGSGTLRMNDDPATTVAVGGNVTFGGGSTAGLLTSGTLQLGGTLTQSGDVRSFAPSGSHTTVMSSASGAVSFAAPGTSAFQNLAIGGGSSVSLLTNATVLGTLSRRSPDAASTIQASAGRTLTIGGLVLNGASQFTLNNVSLRFVDGTSDATMNNVRFTGFPPNYGGVVLEVARTTGPALTFNALSFDVTLSVTGRLLRNSGSQTVTILSSMPANGVLNVTYDITGTGGVVW
jgi:hypothetical protein